MYEKENEEVAKVIKWIHEDRLLWELVYEEIGTSWTNKDIISILRTMIEKELYQLVMVLIARLNHGKEMHEAIGNIITNRLQLKSYDRGILTECVTEMENIARKYNTLDKQIRI